MKDEEHQIQCACVRWFAYQYPQYKGLLFAIPNGSYRSKATAGKLKAEGVFPGVADLILLVPLVIDVPKEIVIFHGFCIELKTKQGRQSPEQKEWQEKVEAQGYKYAVVRSLEDFIKQINDYLQ